MSVSMAVLPTVLGIAAALPVAGVAVVFLVRRWRRRATRLRLEDKDFDLVFPEGPGDKPARGTVARRQVKPR